MLIILSCRLYTISIQKNYYKSILTYCKEHRDIKFTDKILCGIKSINFNSTYIVDYVDNLNFSM